MTDVRPLSPEATQEECKQWILEELVRKGRCFHLEDDPYDLINVKTGKMFFTSEQAAVMDDAVSVLYSKFTSRGRCPIYWMMRLEKEEARRTGRESWAT